MSPWERMCASERARPGRSRPGRLAGALVVLAGVLVGCSGDEGDTCDIPTAEISAVALVVDSGWDIRATIDFEAGDRRGRNSPLRLCDSDTLEINGDEPEVIEKSDRIEYARSLPVDAERTFTFVLERESQGDRVTFDVELPPAFEITAPLGGDVVDFSQDLLLQWAPAMDGGSMHVSLGEAIGGGECLVATTDGHTYEANGGVTVDDEGQWTIPAGVVSSMSPDDCTLTYTLSRVLLAPYPEELEGSGRVEARTERYIDVVVMQ